VSAFLFLYYKMIKNESEENAAKVMLPSWAPNDVWTKFMSLSEVEFL